MTLMSRTRLDKSAKTSLFIKITPDMRLFIIATATTAADSIEDSSSRSVYLNCKRGGEIK